MSEGTNYFKIGLFVISAMVIAVIALIIFSAGDLFQKKTIVETYFNESVQGLDIGSPIKFRGVPVGKVETISLVAREYPTSHKYILVRMSLENKFLWLGPSDTAGEITERETEKGLRVRMAFLGVTGTAYLETDYLDPKRNPPLKFNWKPLYPYVPSARGTITRLSESVGRIMRNLEQINMLGISAGIEKTLRAMTKTLEEANLEGVSSEARLLLAEIRETNQRISRIVGGPEIKKAVSNASGTAASSRRLVEGAEKPLSEFLASLKQITISINMLTGKVNSAAADLPETLTQIRTTLRRLDSLISSRQQDVEVTADNIRLISENLKELTENAKKHPSHLLFGEPPARSEPGNQR